VVGRTCIAFGHGKLYAYRAADEYLGWVYRCCGILRGHAVHEDPGVHRTEGIDPDTETDPDPEGNRRA
jgi:hypothetical protein